MSPDRRKHRGPHPRDRELFSGRSVDAIRQAVAELSWLLSRGYPSASSHKLVGDRHDLRERQRIAVSRAACSDASRATRQASRAKASEMRGRRLIIDGFNVIVSVEAALAGGVILLCRDNTYRDLASVHGSYRKVEETQRAVTLIGDMLDTLAQTETHWLLDRPVSNSARLAASIEAEAEQRSAAWTVRLVDDPDPLLKRATQPVATSDSAIVDRCKTWLGLTREVIDTYIPEAWVVDLRPSGEASN